MRIGTAIARWKMNRAAARARAEQEPREYRPMRAPWWAFPIRLEDRRRYAAWWEREWWERRIGTLEGAINNAFCIVGLWDVADADFYINGRWRWDFWNTIAEHAWEYARTELDKERQRHAATKQALEASRAYNVKINRALAEIAESVSLMRQELALSRNGDGE